MNYDDNVLLNKYLRTRFLEQELSSIEFVILNNNNNSIMYNQCGIMKFPVNEFDENEAINNLKIILTFFLQNKIYLQNISIITNCTSDSNEFLTILELLYVYYNTIFSHNLNHKATITIPCDFLFVNNEASFSLISEFFHKFKNININLNLQYYTDKDCTDKNFVKNFFKYINIANIQNPINIVISPHNINNISKYYNFWEEQIINYNKYYNTHINIFPAIIEDKNEGWSLENISEYIHFLDDIINKKINFHENLFNFIEDIQNENNPLSVSFKHMGNEISTCSLNQYICVLCNNLMLIPCKGLAHSFFYGGHIKINNNDINFNASNNISGYLNLIHRNSFFAPLCVNCEFKEVCSRGCCSAQFNAMAELNIPLLDVCKMHKEKIKFLFKKYNDLNLFTIMYENNCLTQEEILIIHKILSMEDTYEL